METQALQMDRSEARELYRDYKKHLHYSQPIDHESCEPTNYLLRAALLSRRLKV